MLNLQTITEELGTLCKGRAWVVVTSQEDIDAVLGEANQARSNDFSKITARFHTRLSLSSSNTDEVIQPRLLDEDRPPPRPRWRPCGRPRATSSRTSSRSTTMR